MSDPDRYRFADSVEIAAPPSAVYALVSDVTRVGEWSPVCRGCRWEDADGLRAGAHFVGRNEDMGRTWETRSTVTVAEPGREFAWVVNDGLVEWSFSLAPAGEGTRLTESWHCTPAAREYFRGKYGDTAGAELDNRVGAAHSGIPASLAAIKRIAETGS